MTSPIMTPPIVTATRLVLATPVLAGVLLLASLTGCESSYSSLRFRPVDTSTQIRVPDVAVSVTREGSTLTEVKTAPQGHVDLPALQAGDILSFSKPGYETTTLELGYSSFSLRSPSTLASPSPFDLRDLDFVPVPLHRQGNVSKPADHP